MTMKKKSMATVEIECSNTHSMPVFSDFLSEVQKRFDIEKEAAAHVFGQKTPTIKLLLLATLLGKTLLMVFFAIAIFRLPKGKQNIF